MNYCYKINKNDSFYRNCNSVYFKHENLIISIDINYYFRNNMIKINTYNIDTNEFTPNDIFNKVEYSKLTKVDHIFNANEYGVAIDVQNKMFSNTIKYPYLISEIDGNHVTLCKHNNIFYIFHSEIEIYEIGVFIFDSINNTINNHDFIEIDSSKITNKFKNIHNKTIISCGIHNDNIILKVDENDDTELVYRYDIKTDCVITLFEIQNLYADYNEINILNNIVYILNKNNIYTRDANQNKIINKFEICDEKESVIFWDIYNDKLVIICGNYCDFSGIIYSDEWRTHRNLQIKIFDLELFI